MKAAIGAFLAALVVVGLAGCSTLLAVKGEERRADAMGVVSGTVATEQTART